MFVQNDLKEMLELNAINKKLTELSSSMPKFNKDTSIISTPVINFINTDSKDTNFQKIINNNKNIQKNLIENTNKCYLSPPITFEAFSSNNSDVTSCDSPLSSSTSTESLNHVVVFNNQL